MNELPPIAGPWDGWGHHMWGGHMWGGGPGWLWGPAMMLAWTGIIALTAWLVARAVVRARTAGPKARSGLDHAHAVLAERYAKGEISTEEYRERLAQLGHASPETHGTNQ
ncbi:SHOCT domain-containing protein [Sphaerimonospora cavernae]|uniref:SHOCT domain-containing protein n=1 Tax=Sphaerimonospora cavernae TaxID=1740611 RepID=A0ABV6UBJ0_9ACTN